MKLGFWSQVTLFSLLIVAATASTWESQPTGQDNPTEEQLASFRVALEQLLRGGATEPAAPSRIENEGSMRSQVSANRPPECSYNNFNFSTLTKSSDYYTTDVDTRSTIWMNMCAPAKSKPGKCASENGMVCEESSKGVQRTLAFWDAVPHPEWRWDSTKKTYSLSIHNSPQNCPTGSTVRTGLRTMIMLRKFHLVDSAILLITLLFSGFLASCNHSLIFIFCALLILQLVRNHVIVHFMCNPQGQWISKGVDKIPCSTTLYFSTPRLCPTPR